MRPGGEPVAVALEFKPELFVIDTQIAVAAAGDGLGPHRLHFLGDDADVGLMAAVIGEAIKASAVVETAEQDDVVLQRDVGAPAAAAATAPASSATATEAAA